MLWQFCDQPSKQNIIVMTPNAVLGGKSHLSLFTTSLGCLSETYNQSNCLLSSNDAEPSHLPLFNYRQKCISLSKNKRFVISWNFPYLFSQFI